MKTMTLNEARRVLSLYTSLSLRDKLTMLARLVFCVNPIVRVLGEYLPEKGTIMDMGCGYGIISHLVSDSCPDRNVVGVDMSSRRIEVARKSVNGKKNVKFHKADLRQFQIPQCDAVMMIDFLSAIPYQDQGQMLACCHDRLYDSGVLIIKDNCKTPRWKYLYAYFEDAVKMKLGIYGRELRENSPQFRDTQEFLALLDEIGFRATVFPLESRLPYPGVFYICQKAGRN